MNKTHLIKSKENFIIGAAIVDTMFNIKRLPRSGEDISAFNETPIAGGCALNAACVLKEFNAPFTLCAPFGTGTNAVFLRESLGKIGIETPLVIDEEVEGGIKDNGHCVTLVEETGERTFITSSGIECFFKHEWLLRFDTKGIKRIYVSGYEIEGEGGEAIIKFIKNIPCAKIFFAPGPRISDMRANPRSQKKLDAIFSLSPIVHLNEDEIKSYTGANGLKEAIESLMSKTNSPVIVTRGKHGAVLAKNAKDIKEFSAESVKVVDTSGAGDAHCGAVITALSFDIILDDSVRFANSVAARVAASSGPRFVNQIGGIEKWL